MIYMFLSNNPSSGDINSSNLSYLHYFFYCFLKIKINKNRISSSITLLSETTMRFHSEVVVHCRYCWVVYLFLASIFSCYVRYFRIFFLTDIEPLQCKFYASMMKSNLLNGQRLLLSSFMA